ARRTRTTDRERRLRSTRLVDEKDCCRTRIGDRRVVEGRPFSAPAPSGKCLLDHWLHGSWRRVADDRDERAPGLVVRLVESDDIVAGDRFQRLLGHHAAVGMARSKHDTWKDPAGD